MLNQLPCILIVDDSATTRAMIKRVIEMTQLPVQSVLEAADGRDALELMKINRIDLVLADLNMPVMGGVEMIARMRKDASLRLIPVLVISAQPDDEQIVALKQNGVAGYLPKPFTPERVRSLIEPLLNPFADSNADATHCHDASGATLAEVVAEALETMAFITPDSIATSGSMATLLGARAVRVKFDGQGISGSLTLVASVQFGAIIAANCNSYGALSDAEDALKELANIACGLLLRHREGGCHGFELYPPTIETVDDVEHLFGGDNSVFLNAEGFQLAVNITTQTAQLAHEGSSS